jgi:hypothetical protein
VSLFICTLDLGFLKPLCSKARKLIIVISGVYYRGLLHLASKTALTITELSKQAVGTKCKIDYLENLAVT